MLCPLFAFCRNFFRNECMVVQLYYAKLAGSTSHEYSCLLFGQCACNCRCMWKLTVIDEYQGYKLYTDGLHSKDVHYKFNGRFFYSIAEGCCCLFSKMQS